ncbi:MAG: tripartite tricarboxylate transporter substrate binding protein, partial [Betaproteobacteria bacterium]|nr:tripartite tricarboxylate transporter substrate binding protein [Betaproteobacteria bacterium]
MIRSMICAAGLVALSLAASAGLSQSYPQKSIRFIVPFAPGGGTDVIARVMAKKLSEIVGQPVVVDNRGGAGGVLATDLAAKAPPDGYTMILSTTALAFSAALYPKLPYDTLRDLAPVTKVAVQPFILVVHPSLPVTSVKHLVALARAKPGQITYASGGVGSGFHLAAELLKLKANIDLLHVPYRGGGPALVDLLSGHVQVMVSTLAITLPHTKAGKLRPLAVTV